MNRCFNVGDIVRIKALPGISLATLFDGKIGVIARLPVSQDNTYEVYVDDRTLWLSAVELEPLPHEEHHEI